MKRKRIEADPFYRAILAELADTEWQIAEANFMREPAAESEIQPGTLVRIDRIPGWLTHDLPADEAERLRALVGTEMRVLEIDARGYLWFGACGPWFCLRSDEVRRV